MTDDDMLTAAYLDEHHPGWRDVARRVVVNETASREQLGALTRMDETQVDTGSEAVESDAVRKMAQSIDPLILAFVDEHRALAAERDALREVLRPFAAAGQILDTINDPGGFAWATFGDEDEAELNLVAADADKDVVSINASWDKEPATFVGPTLTVAMFIAAWKALEGWRPDTRERAERDAAIARAEAAEAERDALVRVADAARTLLHYRAFARQGLATTYDRLRDALDALPPGLGQSDT